MRRVFVLCVFLSACAQTTAPVAGSRSAVLARALLYPVGVTLLMSDGTLCAGHRPGRARDWTGQLSGCPHLLAYSVTGSDPSIPRQLLSRAATSTAATAQVSVAGQLFVAP